MPLLAALLIALLSMQAAPQPLRAGVAAAPTATGVLAMAGAPLAPGTAVVLVGIDTPQQVSYATVLKRLTASDMMTQHQVSGPFYELVAEHDSAGLPALAIAVAGLATFERAGESLVIHLGNPRMDLRVRSCASSEGLHLTLWSGTPLKSRRVWHQYYYLGYDVEPTCTAADVEGAR